MSEAFQPVLTARMHKPDSAAIESYVADGGYQENRQVIMPYRRPRDGSEPPAWQHDLNTVLKRVRAHIEHAFAHMKWWNILRNCRHTELGKWGWRLFARKGHRNIAVGAIARKLATQAWHLLRGNKPELLEPSKSRHTKLRTLTVLLGKALRTEMQLPPTIAECITHFDQKIANSKKLLKT